MARCTRTEKLEVHHIRRDGGNEGDNAQVLCETCHQATDTFGAPGESPPPFSDLVKLIALSLANDQCECTSTRGCH